LSQKLKDVNFCAIPYRREFGSGLKQLVTRMTSSRHGTKLGKGSYFCANLFKGKAYHVHTYLPVPNTDAIRQAFGPPYQPSYPFFWLFCYLDTILAQKTARRIAPDRWQQFASQLLFNKGYV
jgi:hypothetical protein